MVHKAAVVVEPALAVIIYNRDDEAIGMGGASPPEITIPSIMIKSSLGESIASTLVTDTVNVTLDADQEPRYTDNSLRWVLFEDDGTARPFGKGSREMWDPTCLGLPGKVSDTQNVCGGGDFGGVHDNSSVPNHAFALAVAGGTYNGQTIAGIGLTKAIHIYHRAQEAYQTHSMNFSDHADALAQACSDLLGQSLKVLGSTTVSGQTI